MLLLLGAYGTTSFLGWLLLGLRESSAECGPLLTKIGRRKRLQSRVWTVKTYYGCTAVTRVVMVDVVTSFNRNAPRVTADEWIIITAAAKAGIILSLGNQAQALSGSGSTASRSPFQKTEQGDCQKIAGYLHQS